MAVDLLSMTLLERARAHYRHCLLCEHRCGVDRIAGERGPCKAGAEVRLFRHRIEFGEEPEIVPSHLFYVSGCDLRCAFCIAEINAFDPRRGQLMNAESFRQAVAWGRSRGARNIQWVGGEPTIHLPAILDLMAGSADLPPVVWKSDFHGTPESFELLADVVDVYVADFKFGNDDCASRLARVTNYTSILKRNLAIAAAQKDLIVRHLLMPGHFDCCFRPVVEWLARSLTRVRFSIRDGFLPKWQVHRYAELCGILPPDVARRAHQVAAAAGLNVIY